MAVTLEHPESTSPARAPGDLTSRAVAEAYVGGVCFKLGPPGLLGAELEWLTEHGECPAPRPPSSAFAAALGPHAPPSVAPDSPALPLPGGSRITVEPGGQIELSSAPFRTAAELCARLDSDIRTLRALLATQRIRIVPEAADAHRLPERVLASPRYHAMERVFDGIGPFGRLMMCNTAATQVSVDAGADRAEVTARWRTVHAVGPALIAAFARSPGLRGAPAGMWASQRMRTWLRLDGTRTRPPVADWSDPVAAYSRWALDVPLLCVRGPCGANGADWCAPPGATFADWLSGALDDEIGRRPSRDDLDYHLTTLFPPVRASGHLEIRYLDAQPEGAWTAPIHAVDALLGAPAVAAEAAELAEPLADAWLDAARHGLADPQIRALAADVLALAAAHAPTRAARAELDAAAHRCRRGHTPDGVAAGP
ncbi:ergothioneine biosynthesis glutamate--cysteine ligase EgtA [Nocardia puris]|uniref:Glutamate--cysteine ligase EgtA n=2 Tax=Nocardia puris TaxID=208602 RepID=A0A366DUG4_9NOCA|nr:ergothioneine biosynthesis glutamate--cysteine ligase EgtA [Nocardia puris]MBF6210662.1 ergothioneine biosynthesis glutamate--cysteine ligase EgtA [Nocardia puris]MBF6364269.1 ergothioneine biosynthesis glutamate--cysteine ligase EgtA [Nocardia puris]MBF6459198.1 ergothioneine biosynthesis glutamate--cysteine ligase EgtA [Nocardia puris]RBO92848.1 glutamate--cysteine ligase [Nocardia puris]